MPTVVNTVSKAHQKGRVARRELEGEEAAIESVAARLAKALIHQKQTKEFIEVERSYPMHSLLNLEADARFHVAPRFSDHVASERSSQPSSAVIRGRPIIVDRSPERAPSPPKEYSLPYPPTAHLDRSNEHLEEFVSRDRTGVVMLETRLRSVEAELKARVERSRVEEQEFKRIEDGWAQELTALRIRTAEQQTDITDLHDAIRRLKVDLAARDAEVSSLKGGRQRPCSLLTKYVYNAVNSLLVYRCSEQDGLRQLRIFGQVQGRERGSLDRYA
jgi:hypothetical protein